MITLNENGTIQLKIGKFELQDYMDNEIIDLIEDFNYGILNKQPILMRIEIPNNEFYILFHKTNTFIIDKKNKTLQQEEFGIFEYGKELLNDILDQKEQIIEMSKEFLDDEEIEKIFNLNLQQLEIALKDDYQYEIGNITRITLEKLNDALYLHSIACIYDNQDNVETFRLVTYDNIYLIILTKLKKTTKIDFEIISQNLVQYCTNIYKNIQSNKKIKKTKELLDIMSENLKEYGVNV